VPAVFARRGERVTQGALAQESRGPQAQQAVRPGPADVREPCEPVAAEPGLPGLRDIAAVAKARPAESGDESPPRRTVVHGAGGQPQGQPCRLVGDEAVQWAARAPQGGLPPRGQALAACMRRHAGGHRRRGPSRRCRPSQGSGLCGGGAREAPRAGRKRQDHRREPAVEPARFPGRWGEAWWNQPSRREPLSVARSSVARTHVILGNNWGRRQGTLAEANGITMPICQSEVHSSIKHEASGGFLRALEDRGACWRLSKDSGLT
jgi:hypothetical protein